MTPTEDRDPPWVLPAILTPFDAGGHVKTDTLAGLVEFQVDDGVDGFFICGSTGLGPLMSEEERKEVAETVVAASGDLVTIVQVGSLELEKTLRLARHAEELGASAVASLPPLYYRFGDRWVYAHYERLASTVSVPLLCYNIPVYAGYDVAVSLLSKMAADGVVDGVKDSTGSMERLSRVMEDCPEDFVTLNGSEHLITSSLARGVTGSVSGSANAFPELIVDLTEAYSAGDLDMTSELQSRLDRVRVLMGGRFIPSLYEALDLRGIEVGKPKGDVPMLSEKERDALAKGLRAEGLIP